MNHARRFRVRCWFCGKEARRTGPRLRVGVVGTARTVPTFGLCLGVLGKMPVGGNPRLCYEPMMRRGDAVAVLTAALAYERGGWNVRSEYDGQQP